MYYYLLGRYFSREPFLGDLDCALIKINQMQLGWIRYSKDLFREISVENPNFSTPF